MIDKEFILSVMKQNNELHNIIIELSKEKSIITNTNITGNTTNSHNKSFNLQFFLNETCKDAMNIGDFVDSLKLQLSDLEKVGEVGYIEGISNIIVKNLKELDVTKRPVHCTDKKREIVYIKDNNIWEKDEDKSKMHKLIKKVVYKNANMFSKFREVHPDCTKYYSKFSDQYHKIIYESMGGKGDNEDEKNEKIIKNVLKQVTIDKNI
jgi:Txe/YoeB family toxin of Txe-Axe toxin-antitoxin module